MSKHFWSSDLKGRGHWGTQALWMDKAETGLKAKGMCVERHLQIQLRAWKFLTNQAQEQFCSTEYGLLATRLSNHTFNLYNHRECL